MQRAIDVKEHKRAVTRPLVKVFSRYGRHKFEISRTVSFFLLHENFLYGAYNKVHVVVEDCSRSRTFRALFLSIVHSSRNIAGISITIPSNTYGQHLHSFKSFDNKILLIVPRFNLINLTNSYITSKWRFNNAISILLIYFNNEQLLSPSFSSIVFRAFVSLTNNLEYFFTIRTLVSPSRSYLHVNAIFRARSLQTRKMLADTSAPAVNQVFRLALRLLGQRNQYSRIVPQPGP